MRESIGEDGESGETMEKLSPVREKQCEMREEMESAKGAKMQGGESGCRSMYPMENDTPNDCGVRYTDRTSGQAALHMLVKGETSRFLQHLSNLLR